MKFLLYAPGLGDRTPEGLRPYSLGLDGYMFALSGLGSVESTEEIPAAVQWAAEKGGDGVLLWFGPIEQIPAGITVPIVPILGTGPLISLSEEPIARLVNDWAAQLRTCGYAIVTSDAIGRGIRALLGSDFPIATIYHPIVEPKVDPKRRLAAHSKEHAAELRTDQWIFDSASIGLSADLLVPIARSHGSRVEPPANSMASMSAKNETVHDLHNAPGSMGKAALRGVLYISSVDPVKEYANWHDLVTAFCLTFRDVGDATLALLFSKPNLDALISTTIETLCRLAPFKCRVIGITGPLDDAAFEELAAATSYYVHALGTAGACPTLLEFMACGVPALAASHTDPGVCNENALAFRSSLAEASGVDGAGQLLGANYQISWESLCDALASSYRLAGDSNKYAGAAMRAHHGVLTVCSVPMVAAQFRSFFTKSGIAMLRMSG
jgi:glycosyltransferase involved in cell wall biosynthesis